MRFFGFFIIRWQRLQELHARNRELLAEAMRLRGLIEQLEKDAHPLILVKEANFTPATAPAELRAIKQGDTNA